METPFKLESGNNYESPEGVTVVVTKITIEIDYNGDATTWVDYWYDDSGRTGEERNSAQTLAGFLTREVE